MATPKVTLEVDLKDKLTAKLNRMNKEIQARGGPAMVKLAKATRRAELDLKRLGGTAQKTNKIWTRFTKGIAIGNLAAIGAAKAIGTLVDGLNQIGEATKVAARIEVLNGVMQFTGQAAGFSRRELDENVKALQAQGITISESLGLQQRFIQANLDIGLATDIATVAQNAAVIAGVNSSEAALGLTDAIVKQRPILLKQFGIITSLDQIYDKQAETLGKARDELTATEKRMGFFNEIMEQATTIAGAYDTAMDFAGKRLTSLPRHFEAAQQAVGQHFLPAFNTAITVTEKLLKGITAAFGDPIDLIAASKKKFDNVSAASLKLADRYDELAGKTREGTIEHEELQDILDTIARNNPELVTKWDEYGKAVEISTGKLRDNLEAQRSLIAVREEEALRELGERYRIANQALQNNIELQKNKKQIDTENLKLIEDQEAGWKTSAETIVILSDELESLAFKAGASFPALVEGTERYDFALSLLPQALVDLIIATEKADVSTRNLGDTIEETVNKMPTSFFKSNLPTFSFKPILDKIEREKKDAEKAEEERVKLHNKTLEETEQVHFEASLIGLNEHIAAKQEAERAHEQWLIELKERNVLSESEFDQARLDSLAIMQEDIATITLEATEALTQDYIEKWSTAIDATEQAFTGLTDILISDTKFVGRAMKKVFEDIGKSIVTNLVQKGIKALAEYSLGLFAAKTAAKLFGDGQQAATIGTVNQAAATAALATATGGVATTSVLAAGAMKVETGVVVGLTAKYIALAAAKNAASLGTTTAASIGAAVATKAALDPLLLDGFDDPSNDRVAFRHGKDYADQFMAGTQTRFRAPSFAGDVVRSFPTPSGGDNGAPMGSSMGQSSLTVQVMGSIMSERDFMDIMKDVLENFSDGSFDFDRTLTGSPS